ncbi:MAG: citrate synthase [Myxococcales bacterium]|nr:citrate synthase [Myxococcales bacterium]MCB9578784.1 citrate synthase [Polyangiaceae bacterium]
MSGLEGVMVADTELSEVDGQRGQLVIRGFEVEDLAERATLSEAIALLADGNLDAGDLREKLGAGRLRGHAALGPALLAQPDAMSALRAAVAAVPEEALGDGARNAAAELSGRMAATAAAWARHARGLAPIAPAPERDHAEDTLRMLSGAVPDPALAAALHRYWVTVADHGMNASTFAARVVASTGARRVSAITAALGALEGPLHGGAPGPVLDMLDAIATPDAASGWLGRELDAGRRIMGMGHRVYRVRDPRARVLERAVETLEREAVGSVAERLALARSVERAAEAELRARHPERRLEANVEFYTAVLLEALGIPRQLFTAIFACGRVAGWCAHVAEQRQRGRLIRPSSRYVGPAPSSRRITA